MNRCATYTTGACPTSFCHSATARTPSRHKLSARKARRAQAATGSVGIRYQELDWQAVRNDATIHGRLNSGNRRHY
jgi:hypothetical protein